MWAWALLWACATLPRRRAVPPDPDPGVAKHGLKRRALPLPCPLSVAGRRGSLCLRDGPRRPTPAAEVPGTAARLRMMVLFVVQIETCPPEQRIGGLPERPDHQSDTATLTSQRRDPGSQTAPSPLEDVRQLLRALHGQLLAKHADLAGTDACRKPPAGDVRP